MQQWIAGRPVLLGRGSRQNRAYYYEQTKTDGEVILMPVET